MNTFAEKVIKFYQVIRFPEDLKAGIDIMHPHLNPEAAEVSAKFYRKFYSDNHDRTFIIGINPGRLGGGVTGVPFTDPGKLETVCGIKHELTGKSELSAEFIYNVIQQYGGVKAFYDKFYFTSLSPLGLMRNGLNFNYYDDKEFLSQLLPVMSGWIAQQIDFGATRTRCICLGSGQNLRYLKLINEEHCFFDRIDVLDHPRFIMQYKRKLLNDYIQKYIAVLKDD